MESVGLQARFLGDHGKGLAAVEPILDGFTFERFVEYTAGFDCGCVHGLAGSLFTQFPARQFEATSIEDESEKEDEDETNSAREQNQKIESK